MAPNLTTVLASFLLAFKAVLVEGSEVAIIAVATVNRLGKKNVLLGVFTETVMDNNEVRGKILRAVYDHDMQRAGEWLHIVHLQKAVPDVEEKLFNTNLYYLYRSRLIEGKGIPQDLPVKIRITPAGIDVVENADIAKRYQIQVLQIGTNYGQVAQAGTGNTISQTQQITFSDLRKAVDDRTDISSEDKENIKTILTELDEGIQDGTITKKAIDSAKRALAKYGWLILPLSEVLKHGLGLR